MKRPPPTISSAQSKSIATHSKFQAQSEAYDQKVETIRLDLERSFSETRAVLRRNSASIQAANKWLPRIASVPVTALAIGLIFVATYGLWSGDLPAIAKYSKVHVLRDLNPVAFWFAFVYHSAIAAMFTWLAVKLLRATGWLRASKT